jgi:hypothetical protein
MNLTLLCLFQFLGGASFPGHIPPPPPIAPPPAQGYTGSGGIMGGGAKRKRRPRPATPLEEEELFLMGIL